MGVGTVRVSYAVFAVVLIGLGILGLIKGDFAPGLAPVPESIPGRIAVVYLCAFVCIACGGGLLFRRVAPLAALVLFGWLLIWLILLRVPWMFVEFSVGMWWSASSTAVITATAWVLYAQFAKEWDKAHLSLIVDEGGLRIARTLFGIGLIPIGLAHFIYLEATAPLVPGWLLWPVFWSYFTGAAFIAAGLAAVTGVLARLGSALMALQIGLLTLIVWVPRVVTGDLNAFQWGEFVVSVFLTACTWVIADSYCDSSWFAIRRK